MESLDREDVPPPMTDEAAVLDAPAPAQPERPRPLIPVAEWPDSGLVAAIRRDPPDSAALDVLAERHWRQLFGRCQLLTGDRDRARDLAQEAWCRLLRKRHALRTDGNFPAYLTTIATNLWRDRHRAASRAGAMADERLASLDAPQEHEGDDLGSLGAIVPDLATLVADAQRRLMLDVDHALAALDPRLREVLIARFIDGESCADIGRRHGRTEQTVSGWIREAVRQVQAYFREPRLDRDRAEPHANSRDD